MTWNGEANITVLDASGSAVNVSSSKVQVKMGCAISGTDFAIVATVSPNTVQQNFTGGPMPESAGQVCQDGGVVLCMKMPATTAGSVRGSGGSAKTITGATNANPIVITATAHGFITGQQVTIASVGGNTAANGTFVITRLSADTFSIAKAGNSAYTAGGTATLTGLYATATGTSAVTVDGASVIVDDYYLQLEVLTGGTIGTAGIQLQVSLDAGRNFGGPIALGTATSLVVTGTGITLDFGAGTLIAGDTFQFSTIGPVWSTADIATAITALRASPYAQSGFGGGIHLVGVAAGTDASGLQTAVEALTQAFIYARAMVDVRDASPPVKWGGTGETESAWMTSINADYSSPSAKRVLGAPGHYNQPSVFPNAMAGLPAYRRPLTWSQAARQVEIAPQQHSGQVDLGPLDTIVVDNINDPKDGFIYHDEALNPGLDNFMPGGAGRFCAARKRVGEPGFFITNPRLLAPAGSQYTFWPLGAVIDIVCSITHQVAQQEINSTVRTAKAAKGGQIYENDARAIEKKIGGAIRNYVQAPGMISDFTVIVDRTNNVQSTKTVNIAVECEALGYILQENITVGFAQAST